MRAIQLIRVSQEGKQGASLESWLSKHRLISLLKPLHTRGFSQLAPLWRLSSAQINNLILDMKINARSRRKFLQAIFAHPHNTGLLCGVQGGGKTQHPE